MSPRPAVADITKCSDLGSNWADGSCRPGMGCGFSDYCVCNIPVEQFGELCCRDTTSGVDHCYTKAGIEDYAGSESTNPADATYVNPNSSGTLTAEDKKEPVFFIPQFTLPGSKFIAGQSVQVDGNTLGDYITALYVFFVGVAGILSVVMMIYGGIKYTISFGSPQKLSDARDSITSAMIGLAIALGSYVILLTISPRLVTFQGLSELGSGIGPPLEFEELQQNSVKYGVSYKPVTQNVSTYDAQLLAVVDNDKYLASWLKAIMLVESSGNPQAESKDKYGNTLACGLMQLLPSTAGVSCAELKNNPTLSIQKAWQYFQELLANTCPTHALYKSGATAKCYPEKTNCTDGKFHYAVAAYNGGRGANCSSVDCPGSTWWECEANTGFAETRNYVAKVEDTYNKIQNDPAFAWSQ
ncbi:MAG: lytic transglycosylase domain-containing protein [Patescibacteria group bacterium]